MVKNKNIKCLNLDRKTMYLLLTEVSKGVSYFLSLEELSYNFKHEGWKAIKRYEFNEY